MVPVEMGPEEKEEQWRTITEACASEDYETVKTLCDQLLQHECDDADVYFLRGLSFIHEGSLQAALADLTSAIELDPNCTLYYLRRAEIYDSGGDLERKLADLREGTKLEAQRLVCRTHGNNHHRDPEHLHIKLANELWGAELNQEALAIVASALEINAKSSAGYALRAALHSHFGHTEQAAVDFARSISLEPDSILPYWLRAQIYMDDGEIDACADDLSTVLSLDPENKFAFFLRSHCHVAREDYESSISDLDAALELDSEYSSAYLHRGLSYFELENFEKAIADFMSYTHRQPEVEPYEERGICHAALGNHRSAIVDLTQALELGAMNEYRVLLWRARCSNALGDLVGTIRDVDRCSELYPDEPEPYFLRGLANHLLGNLDEAVDDFTACSIKNNSAPSAYEQRGNVYMSQGKYAEALDDYTLSIGLDSAFPSPALLKRGECFRCLNRLKEAERDLSAFINNQKDADSGVLINALRSRADVCTQLSKTSAAREDEDEIQRLRKRRFTEYDTVSTNQLDRLFDESIMVAREKQEKLAEFVDKEFGGDWRYDYSISDCRMTLSSTKSPGFVKPLQLLGTKQFELDMRTLATMLSPNQEWLWAWANSYTPTNSSEPSRALLEIGEARQVEELCIDSPFLLDGDLANKLRIIGVANCDADALFMSAEGDLVSYFLLKAPFLKLKPWAGSLQALHDEFTFVIEREPVKNPRLALTSYLDKRQIGYTCDWESVRITDKEGQYLLYVFNRAGLLLESETRILAPEEVH